MMRTRETWGNWGGRALLSCLLLLRMAESFQFISRPLRTVPIIHRDEQFSVLRSTGGDRSAASSGSRLQYLFRSGPLNAAASVAPRPMQMKVPSYDEKPDLKLGVLLLQLGGPERADDVEGFLYNLFADPGEQTVTVAALM